MTTSAPQWPGREGIHEPREETDTGGVARRRYRHRRCESCSGSPSKAVRARASARQLPRPTALRAVPDTTTLGRLSAASRPITRGHTHGSTRGSTSDPTRGSVRRSARSRVRRPTRGSIRGVASCTARSSVAAAVHGAAWPVRGRADPKERELRVARRRARANLPSPAAVTRDIALALLEVEAGCRSAAQLERVVSPKLWETLERCIGRRGGPLPSGRSVMSVHCQENTPGLADTMAVVRKGDLVRPDCPRLDAGGGRWVVTELRWWRNETDTATTPAETADRHIEPDRTPQRRMDKLTRNRGSGDREVVVPVPAQGAAVRAVRRFGGRDGGALLEGATAVAGWPVPAGREHPARPRGIRARPASPAPRPPPQAPRHLPVAPPPGCAHLR